MKVLFATLSVLLDICVFGLAYITTKTDPTDMTVRIERYHKLTHQKFDDSKFEFYCNRCDTNVKQYSKHCGKC